MYIRHLPPRIAAEDIVEVYIHVLITFSGVVWVAYRELHVCGDIFVMDSLLLTLGMQRGL